MQIDFQLCIYASPVIDLAYILYVVGDSQVRDECRAELLKIYHDEFTSVLEKLGYLKTPPSLLDLHIELMRNGFMGMLDNNPNFTTIPNHFLFAEVFVSICFLPMFFMDFSKFSDVGEFDGKVTVEKMEFFRTMTFREPVYKAIMEKELLRFLHNGQLDLQ